MNNQQTKNVCIPQKLFDNMFEVYQKWEEFNNEFEDFLLGHDEEFVEKMRKARKEYLEGKSRDIGVLKQELISK